MNKHLFLPRFLKVSLLPCSISFLLGVNPFQKCSFDDADSSWSLRSNYSCPVKYHNAPKDQFNA